MAEQHKYTNTEWSLLRLDIFEHLVKQLPWTQEFLEKHFLEILILSFDISRHLHMVHIFVFYYDIQYKQNRL